MQTLTIDYPSESVEVLPVPRSQLKALRQHFVELQSYWVEFVFSVGDVVADQHCWELMSKIAFLLPQVDNPSVTGFKLEAIGNDYEQLEALFLCLGKEVAVEQVHQHNLALFDLDQFAGCKILNLHKFNPRRILEEADEMRRDREAERLKVETPKKNPAKAKTSA